MINITVCILKGTLSGEGWVKLFSVYRSDSRLTQDIAYVWTRIIKEVLALTGHLAKLEIQVIREGYSSIRYFAKLSYKEN